MGPGGTAYCVPADLAIYGCPAQALAQFAPIASNATLLANCLAASGQADSFMRSRYPIDNGGLLTWGTEITMHVAWIATYVTFSAMGYASESGADRQIEDRYYQAVGYPGQRDSGYFPGIERQRIHPMVTFNTPNPPNQFSSPMVVSQAARFQPGGPSGQASTIPSGYGPSGWPYHL
jgi:hypothetical protein